MNDQRKGRGVWIPPEIFEMQRTGQLGPTEIVLLSIIEGLSKGPDGCYATNGYLAERMGLSVDRVRRVISKLRGLGLVVWGGFDGRTRYLRTTIGATTPESLDRAETPSPTGRKRPPESTTLGSTSLSPQPGGVAEGFGVAVNVAAPTTQFDTDIATQLLAATRRFFGPGHPVTRKARLSNWADHIRRLRVLDEVPPDKITAVMDWYSENIGGDFVPQVFSGKSFRHKYPALESALHRDRVASVPVSPEAEAVMARLGGIAWPKGAAQAVPAAITTTLDGYNAWLSDLRVFVDKLRRGDLEGDYGSERKRLYGFGRHLVKVMPAPSHFAQNWMVAVHGQVAGWSGWSGSFNSLVFGPRSKRFRDIGRGHAGEYAGDPDRWDRFVGVMRDEMREGLDANQQTRCNG